MFDKHNSNSERFKVPFLNAVLYVTDFVLLFFIPFIIVILSIITKSFWGDEILSLQFSSQDLPNLVHSLASDYHPPLYFLFLKGWIFIAGDSEIALRIFQGMQGILFLLFSLLLFRKLLPGYRYHPFWLVLISSSELWLFMPMLRYYTFAASLVIFSSLVFLNLLEKNNRTTSILLLISYIALLYTDYPSSFIILFHIIYILFKNRTLFWNIIVIDIISIIFFSPWFITTIHQVKQLLGGNQTADLNSSLFVIPIKIGYGFYSFVLGEMIFPFEIPAIILILLIIIAIIPSLRKLKKSFGNTIFTYGFSLAVFGLVFTSVITTVVSTHTSFIYTPSRTFFALPFLLLFFGGIYSIIKKEYFKKLLLITFLLANVYGIGNWILNRHFLMPVYATPWKEVLNEVKGNHGIMLADESLCYNYYRKRLPGIYPVTADPQTIDELKTKLDSSYSNDQRRDIFLILMGRESTDTQPNKDVINYIQTKGTKIFERKYLPVDESYRKIKSRILKRDSYNAKLTLFKYEL